MERLLFTITFISLAVAGHADTDVALKDTAGDHLNVRGNGNVIAHYMDAGGNSTKDKLALMDKPYLHVFDVAGNAPITKTPPANTLTTVVFPSGG